MPIEIVMPRMGLTMEEGTVAQWFHREGEAVVAGEPLLEIETDKTNVEVEAPASGILTQILAGPGQTLPVGAQIGLLLAEGETLQPPSAAPSAAPAEAGERVKASPAARRVARERGIALADVTGRGPGGRIVARDVEDAAGARLEAPEPAGVKASPLARRVAADLGVDLSGVQGTGPGGRVIREDVEGLAGPSALPVAAGTRAAAGMPAVALSVAEGEIQPLTRQQRVMAERMVHSFTSAPHFYLHVDVDARQLVALRSSLLEKLERRAGIRLTYTDLLVKLAAQALAEQPHVMAQWTPDGLRRPERVNVGVAMDAPNGLLVPVLRDADRLGLVEIARWRTETGNRAQAGKLGPQDLEQGTFTISNLGMYGIDAFDAILNPPQAAILAVGRIKERALVVQGQVIAAPMTALSLSVDHRVLDGASAARFLGQLAELVETPALALA